MPGSTTASASPRYVQKGFALPASFGIDPTMLSGIPEVGSGGGRAGRDDDSPGPSGSGSGNDRFGQTHFVIPHVKQHQQQQPQQPATSSGSGSGSGSGGWSYGQGDDDFTEVLRSLAAVDAVHSTKSNHNNNGNNGSLSPNTLKGFDIGRLSFNYHGFQATPNNSSHTQQQQQQHHHHQQSQYSNSSHHAAHPQLSQSLPPEFMRHHSASSVSRHPARPSLAQQQPRSSALDVLHSSLNTADSNNNSNSLFLNFDNLNPYNNSNLHQPANGTHQGFASAFSQGLGSPLINTPLDEGGSQSSAMAAGNGRVSASASASASRPDSNNSGRTVSPQEDGNGNTTSTSNGNNATTSGSGNGNAKSTGRGRTASTGKAPPTRQSRSRQRRPSYSRAVSPAGIKAAVSPKTAAIVIPSSSTTTSSTSPAIPPTGAGDSVSPTPYSPGYPSASVNVQVSLNGRYGVSLPSTSAHAVGAPNWVSQGISFNRHHNTIHGSNTANNHHGGSSTSNNTASNSNGGFSFTNNNNSNNNNTSFGLQRRPSDASTFAPSSFGDSPLIKTNALSLPDEPVGQGNGMGTPLTVATSLDSSAFGFGKKHTDSPPLIPDEPGREDRPRGPPEDKRRKRRESHNAVERRRRDNINERISELATLIPDILLDPSGTGGGSSALDTGKEDSPTAPSQRGGSPPLGTSGMGLTAAQLAQQTASNKPNKGVVLAKSVEYIRYLQQMVQLQMERNKELERRVHTLEGGAGAGAGGGSTDSAGTAQGNGRTGGGGKKGAAMDGNAPHQHHQHQHQQHYHLPDSPSGGMSFANSLATVQEDGSDSLNFEDFLGMNTDTPGKMEDLDDDMEE